MDNYIWGVDSAARVNEILYQCVIRNYGMPHFWGRYLSTVPNASKGLTQQEVLFLHQRGIKILPIYNDFRHAKGYANGKIVARNAIYHAKRLGIPKGKFLFANIERFFLVDEAWIRGWVDTILPSGFRPGIYHDPIRGGFSSAYCKASQKNPNVITQTVLWSAEPEREPTGPNSAPSFHPAQLPCPANVWAWQYGRDAQFCPIDTNLMDQRLFENIW